MREHLPDECGWPDVDEELAQATADYRAGVKAERERCAQRLRTAADEVDKTSRHGTLAASILRAEAEAIEKGGA